MELQEEERELNREDNDLEEGVEEDEEDDDVTTECKTGEAERYEEIRTGESHKGSISQCNLGTDHLLCIPGSSACSA